MPIAMFSPIEIVAVLGVFVIGGAVAVALLYALMRMASRRN